MVSVHCQAALFYSEWVYILCVDIGALYLVQCAEQKAWLWWVEEPTQQPPSVEFICAVDSFQNNWPYINTVGVNSRRGGVGCACVGSRVHCITVKPSLIYFCFVLFSLHDFLFVTNPSMSRLITDQGVMQTSYDMWCSQYYLKWLFCEVGWWGLLGQVHFFASICYFMHMQVIRKSGVDCGSGCYYCLSVTMFTWITYSD